ncbi:glycoside hydrolase family 28 protein [Anaerosporobacter faecicola]|uniref:glycoside hydrolase family 28 protein n=1 Tax=Anaerosporobacter faecicola TaxID=2718714 RepID=UPI00143A71E5|nr:glycoside hydrolase family 28 protein [Anaerosporobacter faecicola]
MNLAILMKTARNVVLEINDEGVYETKCQYDIFVNEEYRCSTNKVVTSLYELWPDTEYLIQVKKEGETLADITFRTDYEFVTLDVTKFGAKGDGIQDDTTFIQAAIMACPKESRVYFPKGTYKVTSIFLKSDIRIEFAKGAMLSADTEREHFPKFQGLIESFDETEEYNLGTWEGNPLVMYSGIITGVNVENVLIYGQGIIEGNASRENWWFNEKVMRGAFRPRLFFINHCKNVVVQGLLFRNSPAWTIHPYFSQNIGFYDVAVENPADSPNTDGLDPESCENVDIVGVRFTLGDDCVAIKSGKIYMGRKHKKPSTNITIRQCLMENGHGAVTIGSEMAGGVNHVFVKDCIFRRTDRGLRIKTRRGRGKDAILDEIVFENIKMEQVMTPFVVNAFYFCDPDGRTEYVQSKETYPVDERTPLIKSLAFRHITCEDCHVAAAYFYGLPEKKIEYIEMKDINVTYAQNPQKDVPAMMNGIEPCSKLGIYANNIEKMVIENVRITGQEGEAMTLLHIDDPQIQ